MGGERSSVPWSLWGGGGGSSSAFISLRAGWWRSLPRDFSGVGEGLRVPASLPVPDGVSSTQIVVNCCCFV